MVVVDGSGGGCGLSGENFWYRVIVGGSGGHDGSNMTVVVGWGEVYIQSVLLRNHQSAEMGFLEKCVDIGALGGDGGRSPPKYSAAGDFLGGE